MSARPVLPPNTSASALLDRYRSHIVEELHRSLAGRNGPPYSLMRYHLGWEDAEGHAVDGRGGKLLRPTLCLLCCEATGGDWKRALPAAGAIEILHNFTLIHDDIEDASDQRHGRDTVWRVWGRAQAINAGDGMFALAHLALLRLTQLGHDSDRVLRAFALFDTAALRLSEGQHLDLLHAEGRTVTAADYLRMIEGKTAALLAASTAIGALLGAGDDRTVGAFEEFGRRLGLAFQIRDDLLGIWGEEAETGKPASDDLRSRKMTYPVLVALERAPDGDELPALLQRSKRSDEDVRRASAALERLGARDESERAAREHAEAAIDALRPIDISPERRAELTALARFAADRSA